MTRFFPEFSACFPPEGVEGLSQLLAQDPRPRYQDDPERIYGLLFGDRNVRFRVEGDTLTVVGIE